MRLLSFVLLLSMFGCTGPTDNTGDDTAGDDTDGVDSDSDGFLDSDDCAPSDPDVNPGAVEICNELDDNCDGTVDEGVTATFFADADGDGWGDPATAVEACAAAAGWVAESGDCDDADVDRSPDADELCDGVDNDCDSDTDESDAVGAGTWYADADGDSYGEPGSASTACDQPVGHVADATDCDDTSATINTAGTEVCNSADDDCDGTVDEADAADASTWYADADGDGYGDSDAPAIACGAPIGHVANAEDCDDADASRYDTCLGLFDGTYSGVWETLSRSTEATYGLMTYQTAEIPYIYNMYDATGQAYDPDTDSWTNLATTAPYSGPWCTMAPSGDDLWMIRNSAVYQYSPGSDTWTTVTTTSATDDSGMTESDEYGVVYGHDARGNIVTYETDTGAVSYYPTGLGREFETRMGYDPGERAIFFGAYDASALYRWDIETGAVTTMSSHPESQLNDIFCSDRSGHIYAAGGTSGTSIYQYDIATDVWAAITPLPSDHGNNGSCTVSADGYLYIGTGSSNTFYRMEIY